MDPVQIFKKSPTIFICKSNSDAADYLGDHLSMKGFIVSLIHLCSEAVEQILKWKPDIVLLDANLPYSGGYEVCRLVRQNYGGLIIVQGWTQDEAVQLQAFDKGADDYVAASESTILLTAKIMAHLRRDRAITKKPHRQLRIGEMFLDAGRSEVFLADQPVKLTTTQFELLWYLAQRSGEVISREELHKSLYKEKYNGHDRSIDVCISRLRRRLRDNAENPIYLKTIHGRGYLLMS